MPDHYAKLTRAVVEIGTQLRRIADAHTTPVADDADDAQTIAILDLKETIRAQRDETAALVQQRERLRDTLHEVLCAFAVGAAYGEPATYTLAHPISKDTYESWSHVVDHPGDGPGYNRSVHVSLATPCGACTHPYNWHGAGPCTFGNETNRCGCADFTTDDARAEAEYHQQLSAEQGQALARAETAREEQRRRAEQAEEQRDKLTALVRDIFASFTTVRADGKTVGYQGPTLAPDQFEDWYDRAHDTASDQPATEERSAAVEQCRAVHPGSDPIRRCIRPAHHTEDHAADDGWHWLEDIAVYPAAEEQPDAR